MTPLQDDTNDRSTSDTSTSTSTAKARSKHADTPLRYSLTHPFPLTHPLAHTHWRTLTRSLTNHTYTGTHSHAQWHI
jgi:hypothetical protein